MVGERGVGGVRSGGRPAGRRASSVSVSLNGTNRAVDGNARTDRSSFVNRASIGKGVAAADRNDLVLRRC